jgi:hypothetical protein
MKQHVKNAGLIFVGVLIIVLQLFTLLAISVTRPVQQTKTVTQKIYVPVTPKLTVTTTATPSAVKVTPFFRHR